VLEDVEAQVQEGPLDSLRKGLSDDELNGLLAEGGSMPLSEAVEVALGVA
jgi:hypothetical protein